MPKATWNTVHQKIDSILSAIKTSGVDYSDELLLALVDYLPPELLMEALEKFERDNLSR